MSGESRCRHSGGLAAGPAPPRHSQPGQCEWPHSNEIGRAEHRVAKGGAGPDQWLCGLRGSTPIAWATEYTVGPMLPMMAAPDDLFEGVWRSRAARIWRDRDRQQAELRRCAEAPELEPSQASAGASLNVAVAAITTAKATAARIATRVQGPGSSGRMATLAPGAAATTIQATSAFGGSKGALANGNTRAGHVSRPKRNRVRAGKTRGRSVYRYSPTVDSPACFHHSDGLNHNTRRPQVLSPSGGRVIRPAFRRLVVSAFGVCCCLLMAVPADASSYIAFRGNATRTVWGFDPALGRWLALPDAPAPVGDGAGLVHAWSENAIYAVRGGYTADFWRYSPSLRTWTRLADLPALVGPGEAWRPACGGRHRSSCCRAVDPMRCGDTTSRRGPGAWPERFPNRSVPAVAWPWRRTGRRHSRLPPAADRRTSIHLTRRSGHGLWSEALRTSSALVAPLRTCTTAVTMSLAVAAPRRSSPLPARTVTRTRLAASPTHRCRSESGGALAASIYQTEYLFAFAGGSNAFLRYSVSQNAWTAIAPAPQSIGPGGALAEYPGTLTGTPLTPVVPLPPFAGSPAITIFSPVTQSSQVIRGTGLPPSAGFCMWLGAYNLGCASTTASGSFAGNFGTTNAPTDYPRTVSVAFNDGPTFTADQTSSVYPQDVPLSPSGNLHFDAPVVSASAEIAGTQFPPGCESSTLYAVTGGVVSGIGGFGTWEGSWRYSFMRPASADTADSYRWTGSGACTGYIFGGTNPGGPIRARCCSRVLRRPPPPRCRQRRW